MSKDFKNNIERKKRVSQSSPADMLLNYPKEIEETEKIKEEKEEVDQKEEQQITEENLNNIVDILENFRNLSPYLQEYTLTRLNGICHHEPKIKSYLASNKESLSVAEAAELLGLTERAILYNLKNGNLTGKKERNRWKISRKSIEDFKK